MPNIIEHFLSGERFSVAEKIEKMDSLLASYASSDEEENDQSLPKSSSSSFSTLQPVKSSSLFSSLPAPKSQKPSSNLLAGDGNRLPRRVVQFRPPVPPKPLDSDDEGEEDEKEKKRPRSEAQLASETSSFLRSIPAPKHSASVLGSGASSGRKSIIVDDDAPALGSSDAANGNQELEVETCLPQWTNDANKLGDLSSTSDTGGFGEQEYSYPQQFDVPQSNDWGSFMPETAFFPSTKRRGKKDIVPEIVEIKQDDLTKDRPRADQTKLTGMAFGPGYQPQDTKGKPSKLHKRKHQIGSLFYDMKQKESELAERRSRGLLTKAQTQGKYGW